MGKITKNGIDLKVGDVVDVWWAPRKDTITKITPYNGSYPGKSGARIAHFVYVSGMTIGNDEHFDVLVDGTPDPDLSILPEYRNAMDAMDVALSIDEMACIYLEFLHMGKGI